MRLETPGRDKFFESTAQIFALLLRKQSESIERPHVESDEIGPDRSAKNREHFEERARLRDRIFEQSARVQFVDVPTR